MTKFGVPNLPSLDSELVDAHERVHDDLAARFHTVDPDASLLLRRFQRRVFNESLANVFLDHGAALMRPRRRFLTDGHRARMRGCDAAFRHADSRLAMWRLGHVDTVIGHDTLTVLNALVESHDLSVRETNPGLVRLISSSFHEAEPDYLPSPGSECAELLKAAIDMAERAPAPAITRAGWLCAVVLAIHPFVDGNGRTARLAFQTVNSSGLANGLDWGTIEQWALHRRAYIEALKATLRPSVPQYRSNAIDTLPFIEFACRSSIAGANLVRRRLEALVTAWNAPWVSASREHRLLEVAVWSDTTASIDELTSLVDDPLCTVAVAGLVDTGRLRWTGSGLLAVADDHPIHAAVGSR